MFRSMMGGQNTALTLLFLVGGYRALDDDRPVLAGAILGLLFYKPPVRDSGRRAADSPPPPSPDRHDRDGGWVVVVGSGDTWSELDNRLV